MNTNQTTNTATTQAPTQLVGYDILDSGGNKLGTVDGVWVDPNTNALKFFGAKTTWLIGKTHVIPAARAQIDDTNRAIQLPYTADQIKGSPTWDTNSALTPDQEAEIRSYYENVQASMPQQSAGAAPAAVPTPATGANVGTGTGQFPVDDVTYDLITTIWEKLKGLEALDEYLEDVHGDQALTSTLQQIRQQDAIAIQQLLPFLGQRLR